jgi:hypothetical protein
LGGLFLAALIVPVVLFNDAAILTAFRNLFVPIVFAFCYFVITPNFGTILAAYWGLVIGGALVSILGIWQAFAGYSASFTISEYSTLQVSDFARISDIISRKIDELHNTKLFPWQKTLAIGLHFYSNNFAEFLIYALIALFVLKGLRRISGQVFYSLYILTATAIVLSGSRTCWLGAALITGVYLLLHTDRLRKLAMILVAIVGSAFIIPNLIDALSFDRFNTVYGRWELDSTGLRIFASSLTHIIFGGGAREYFEHQSQVPHSSIIYMLLYFGLPGAVLYAWSVLVIAVQTLNGYRKCRGTKAETYVRLGAVFSCAWFLFYSETWASLSSASSIMLCLILVLPTIVIRRQDTLNSPREIDERPAPDRVATSGTRNEVLASK